MYNGSCIIELCIFYKLQCKYVIYSRPKRNSDVRETQQKGMWHNAHINLGISAKQLTIFEIPQATPGISASTL